MLQPPAWFERKFNSSPPIELLPNLYARLRGTPARLEELTHALSPELLTSKPNGKWSAQENTGHLTDLEPLWLARVNDYVTGSTELTVTDLRNQRTDEANHNARFLEEILAEFRSRRARLLLRTNELDPALFAKTIPHPRLKTPMTLMDHLHFVAEHDDHHLAQIWQLTQ
jgi:uncharacterized damage-inducible protein DinB